MAAGGFVVENKTISRKHLIVEVDVVKPGDCVSLLHFFIKVKFSD